METTLKDSTRVEIDELEETVKIGDTTLTLQATLDLLDWLRELEYRLESLIDNGEGK